MKKAERISLSRIRQIVLGGLGNLPFHRNSMPYAAAILALGCCAGMQLKAQHAMGLHVGVFKPINSIRMQSGVGLDYTYKASDKVSVGIGAAYYAKSNGSSIRLNGIYTYTLREGVLSPYAGADMGLYIIKEFSIRQVYESINYIGFAPLVGANCKLSDELVLDVRVKYPIMLTIDKGGKGFFPPVYGLTALECNVGAIVFF